MRQPRAALRDSLLYREHYSTFEEYCRDRWGWSRVHAHRQMEAADTAAVLPVGNKPTSERQARELAPTARRDPEAAREAWQSAN